MKYSRITALVLAASALSCASAAADATGNTQAQSAAAVAAASPDKSAGEDRSYAKDFADKKAVLAYMVEGRENTVTYKETNGKNVVFTDATGADITVEHGSDTFKFILKADRQALGKARAAYNKGDWEAAVAQLREIVYPLLPLAALGEGSFSSEYVQMYISALLGAGRINEAYAVAKSLPVDAADAPVISAALEVASALAQKGEMAKALSIAEKVDLRESSQYAASDSLLEVLAALRNAGMVKQVLPIYAKAGAGKNPNADKFKLWSIFCDAVLGNRMSADVYLNAVKIPRESEAFSLFKMIKGYMKQTDPKAPDVNAALDSYAEGIVFGKVSSEWMPELLFRTGMAYKSMENFVASNEIFAQINAMYPESDFAKKGLKEVVKIEKKKVVKEVSHDSDDDEDDDDDE